MKKKKITLLFALAVSTVSLASCGERDYFSKDFDVASQEMDSCATVEYKTIEEKSNLINEFETVKHNTKNNILNGMSVDEYDKFYQNNTTIMMTQEAKGYESGDKNKQVFEFKIKSIYDSKNGSSYYYEYYHLKTSKGDSSYSFVTKAVLKDDKYIVNSDFEFNDYQYCDEKKASGSLKITSFKGNLMNHYKYTVFENCCYPELFSERFNSNNMSIYSNEDKSYIYASVDLNRGGNYGDSDKYVSIRENSLVSYYGEARLGLSDCLGSDKIDGYTDVKLEYISESILDDKIDSTDYIEYNWNDYDRYNYSFGDYFYSLPGSYENGFINVVDELVERNQDKLTIANL